MENNSRLHYISTDNYLNIDSIFYLLRANNTIRCELLRLVDFVHNTAPHRDIHIMDNLPMTQYYTQSFCSNCPISSSNFIV